MIGRLIGFIIFFFVIYFIFNFIKSVFGLSRKIRRESEKFSHRQDSRGHDDRVIELDKDQYKVE